jgi:hypothetical protein
VAPFSFDSKFMKKSNSETPSKSDLTEIMYQDYKVEELSKATNSFGQTLRVGDNAMVFDRMKPIKILALVKKPNGQTMALHKDRGQFVSEVNIDGLLSLGKEVSKIEAKEITGAASSGQYSGPAMWAKSTNKKDWRGASKPLYKGGKFVQVKGKCKKFPYCNQGDINALKIWENVNLNTAIKSVSSKSGLGENVIKNLISKEIELKSPKKK